MASWLDAHSFAVAASGDIGVFQLQAAPELFMGLEDGKLIVVASAAAAAKFRLVCCGDSRLALQAIGFDNAFLSPALLRTLDSPLVLRPHCKAWEVFTVTQHASGAWAISTGKATDAPGYLSPSALKSGAPFHRVAWDSAWEKFHFKLASIPTVDVSPLLRAALLPDDASIRTMYGNSEAIAFVDELRQLPDAARLTVMRLGWAAKTVGFYHVIGHGALDLVSLVKAATGELPMRGGHDNHALWTAHASPGEGRLPAQAALARLAVPAATPALLPAHTPISVISDYVNACLVLEKTLLHALALYEHAVTGVPAPWRYVAAPRPELVDGAVMGGVLALGASMSVRCLRYPRGCPGMGAHRDATWLTLLQQDTAGGLQATIAEDEGAFQEVIPVPGALLVNAGRALAEMSAGFYRAVCHAVVRPASNSTRVSVVFFYDGADKKRTVGGCDGAPAVLETAAAVGKAVGAV